MRLFHREKVKLYAGFQNGVDDFFSEIEFRLQIYLPNISSQLITTVKVFKFSKNLKGSLRPKLSSGGQRRL